MTNFKQGDMVEVSQYPDFPKQFTYAWEFVWQGKGKAYCVVSGLQKELHEWEYIRAIKEPEYIEYTQETLPKGSLWLRQKGIEVERPVGGVFNEGVSLDDTFWTHNELLADFEISEDGRRAYHTCGELK